MILKKVLKAHVRNCLNCLGNLKGHKQLSRNKQLKDTYSGKRCFILGSGMSINNHDLSLLQNEVVMTQNNFFVHKDMKILKPRFHAVVPHYHPKSEDPKWISWFQEMEQALPNDCQLFVGQSSKKMIEENTKFADRTFYLDTRYNPLALKSAPVDLSKTIIAVQTVLTECLAIALYLGFKKIYLVGFDLDQVCNKNNHGRFYGLSKITDTSAERKLDSDLNKDSEIWYFWWTMHLAFDLLRTEANKRGAKIYNATEAGMLETFERIKYLDIFKN